MRHQAVPVEAHQFDAGVDSTGECVGQQFTDLNTITLDEHVKNPGVELGLGEDDGNVVLSMTFWSCTTSRADSSASGFRSTTPTTSKA